MKTLRKILKLIGKITFLFLFLVGLYQFAMWTQYHLVRIKVEKIESNREYDKDLLFYENGGEPLYLINPDYKTTLFFMEGFRAQGTAGMYIDWFKELHRDYKINIIVPVYGLQSSPFIMRDREWHYQEDLRTTIQIYDAYTAMLPKEHRIIGATMSFGAMPLMMIAAKANRPPDYFVLLSPLNTGLDYKVADELTYWFSKQTSWLQYLISHSFPTKSDKRISSWDIVNEENNKKLAEKYDTCPEDNSKKAFSLEQAALYMEEKLIPQVNGKKITIVWGDSDLYFSQSGFQSLAEKLNNAGNDIEIMILENSGHMVLLDNGEAKLKKRILEILLEENNID